MSASTQALKAAATGKKEVTNFPAMLDQFKGEIARALPKHLNPDRMARIALTAFRRSPKLGECDPRSVFAAVIQASQLGLEIDTLGRAYLVPYKVNKKVNNKWESHYECQFIPGWKGLVDLVNRSGQGSVWSGAVFDGDQFDYALGDRPFVTHKPMGEDDSMKLTHVYAVGRVKGAEWPIIEVWPIKKVTKHRDRYNKVGENHYSFENWEMYARKVPLLQVVKYMPLSPELATVIALNDAAEVGGQGLTVKDAIDGTWIPIEPENDAGAKFEQEIEAKKEAAEKKQSVDKETGEIKPRQENGAQDTLTYAQVAERLQGATEVDLLDVAADFIRMVPDSAQRTELATLYTNRRIELNN